MNTPEPSSADDYDDRTTVAVRRVILDIGQIVGAHRDKFAIVGGSVPRLLLQAEDMPHVGTLDLDIALDAEALADVEYATMIQTLLAKGYAQSSELKQFQLYRYVDLRDGGDPIRVLVDFLMPKGAKLKKHRPPLVAGFRVQRADGVDLAPRHFEQLSVTDTMLRGGTNTVRVRVCNIPALLAMKGHALDGRDKHKDAYDIYYCIRNYPGGIRALAEACQPLLLEPSGAAGYRHIDAKFRSFEDFGPIRVREFVEGTAILGDRTPEQWQQDAYGQVDAWLRELGMRAAAR